MAERLCIYAIVSGALGPLRLAGVGGERLQRARVAGVDLVVGRMARMPRPTTPALTRYDRAVRGLMAAHGSLLPARYGTCVATLDELAVIFHERRTAIRAALRLVRNRVQMTTRLFQGQTGVRPGSDRGQSGIGPGSVSGSGYGPTQGRQYLECRAAETRVPGAEPLRAAVRRWVRAEREERLDRGGLAGTIYHLIPRGAVPAYRQALERAAREAGLTTVVTGPWPPYAFAGLIL